MMVLRVEHVEEEEEMVEKTEKVEYTWATLREGLFCKCRTLLLFFFTTSQKATDFLPKKEARKTHLHAY